MSTQDDILATISADQLLAVSLHLMSVNPSDSQARAVASLYERSVAKRLERERADRRALTESIIHSHTNYTPPVPPTSAEPPEDYIPTARRNVSSSPRFGIDPSPIADPEPSTTPDEPA